MRDNSNKICHKGRQNFALLHLSQFFFSFSLHYLIFHDRFLMTQQIMCGLQLEKYNIMQPQNQSILKQFSGKINLSQLYPICCRIQIQSIYQYSHIQSYFYNNINKNTMKFSKSHRQLHQPNYNPPCNVYQPDRNINMNIVSTESLVPPSILNKNTFGNERRFIKEKQLGPGPGAYMQIEKQKQQAKNNKNKVKQGKLQASQQNTPSIPYSYYGQNEDASEKDYIRKLLMRENLSESYKAIAKKEASYSFSKGQRSHSYIPKRQEALPEVKQLEEWKQNQNYDCDLNSSQKKTGLIWQEKIKKASERRLQVIQKLDPSYVPSLELIEMIRRNRDKPTPGPTHYNIEKNTEHEFQLFQNPKGVSFTSAKRFNADKASILGPGLYNPQLVEKNQNYSFGKSQRETLPVKKQENYRYYINPQPDQNFVQMQSRQRASSCPFGSKSSRFPQIVDDGEAPLTLEEERKRNQTKKLNKIIKDRLKIHRKLNEHTQKDEGLLGVSTMASTID